MGNLDPQRFHVAGKSKSSSAALAAQLISPLSPHHRLAPSPASRVSNGLYSSNHGDEGGEQSTRFAMGAERLIGYAACAARS